MPTPTPSRTASPFGWRLPRPWSLAVAAGLLVTASQPPHRLPGWVILPALVLLVAALVRSDRPGRTAWLFGLVHQGTLLSWLFFFRPGPHTPQYWWLVPLQALAAIGYVSLFYLALGWVWGHVRRRSGAGAALLLLPPLWTLMEALRGVGELGFPWCLTGAAWIDTPLQPLAAAGGELALGAATLTTAVLAVALAAPDLRGGPRRRAALAALVLLCAGGWLALAAGGHRALAAARRAAAADSSAVAVATVQPHVSLGDKWNPARIDSSTVPYTRLTAAAARAGAELVVWAETAVPAYVLVDPAERALLRWLRAQADSNDVWLLTGFPDMALLPDGGVARYNGAGLLDSHGVVRARYAKHHLLPVGERLPGQRWLPWLGRIDLGQAEWTPGDPPAPLTVALADGRRLDFAPLICFEAVFPDLARQAVRRGARALVNITNDGWFGMASGPLQHAALARMRATECGVPLIRSANDGVSLVTDAAGRIVARLGLGRRGIVLADVAPGPAGTWYLRYGSWPLAAVLAAWAVLVLLLLSPGRES